MKNPDFDSSQFLSCIFGTNLITNVLDHFKVGPCTLACENNFLKNSLIPSYCEIYINYPFLHA